MRKVDLQTNKYIRRSLSGGFAGIISSPLLILTQHNNLVSIFLGMVIGICLTLIIQPPSKNPADGSHSSLNSMITAAAFGVTLWAGITILLLPLLAGQSPAWTINGMRQLFPALVGWILYGAGVGLLIQMISFIANHYLGPEYQMPALQPVIHTRVIIVGGGFAGVMAAEKLEHLFASDPTVDLRLISDTNALLFTPMLTEVAGGSLEPTHISSPLRSSLHRTHIIHGSVVHIDTQQKRLTLAANTASAQPALLSFDHLILAVGSVSNYLGLKGVEQTAFDFKSLSDAIRLRDHIITMLERADREEDECRRRALVTFVIAGGGFAGAELAGSLNDFIRGALPYYPNIPPDEIQIIVVHSRDAILPELTKSLADYALQRMQARGVTFKLNTRLIDASEGLVQLLPEEQLATETLVWTAGVAPNPLVKMLPTEHDKRGAVIVDATLAVPGLPGIWALGDCASVPDSKTGKPCPPTAQFAIREAKTLAYNIYASVHARPLKQFHFDALGILCVVGHQTACAEIKKFRFSGFFAWILWRGIYLSKLPGLERKLRVLSDWIIELFFPRDIVQTMDTHRAAAPEDDRQAVASSEILR